MNYLIAFVQLGILVPIYADYDLKCPTAGQWRLRAQSYCPHEENYTCLYYIDDDEQKYIESCKGPRKESPGEKTQNNSGNYDNEACSEDRYQPILFSTTKGSDCLLLKSNCNEEGQFIYSNGSTKQDITCGCNYAEQYVFLSQNLSNPCYCRPSVEDCTCYTKACDSGYRLSPDYKCIPENETGGRYNCKEIKTLEKDKVVNLTKGGLEEENIEGRNRDLAIIYTVSLLLLVLFGVLLMVLFLKRIQLYYFYILCTTKVIFTSPLSDIDGIEGEDVVLSCVLCRDGLPVKWFRDDTEIVAGSDPRYKILSVGTRHELTITKAQCVDSDNYSVQFKEFKDRKRSAIVNIQVLFINPLKETVCVEHDDIVFSCKLCADCSIEWYRYNDKINPGDNDRFIISSEGRIHTLTVKKVECGDRGCYSVLFKSHICKADLIVLVPFTSPLSGIDVLVDDTIVLSCVVCMDAVPVKWFRDGTEIASDSDPRYKISSYGTRHELTITEAQCDDDGIYTVQFKDRKCSATVNIRVLFINPLKETVCFEHDGIVFSCKLCADCSIEWYRDNDKINPGDNDRFIISSEGRVHTLTIKQVEYGDSGCYSVHFRHHICKANLIVPAHFTGNIVFSERKYTEDLGDKTRREFKDLAGGIGKDISKLHAHFQGEQKVEIVQFQPCGYVALNLTTENERELLKIVSKKDIPPYTVFDIEYTRSYHSYNNYRVDVILEYTDAFENRNEQKVAKETVAKLFHSVDPSVEKLDFWPNYLLEKFSLETKDFHSKGRLSEVLQKAMTKGNQLRHKTTPVLFPMKYEKKNPEDGEVQINGTFISPGMSTEERISVSYLINSFVDRAAREMFDKQFPPSSLKVALSKKKSNLTTSFNDNKITPSQWEQLFPTSGAVSSSENIEFSLRKRLIWDLQDTVKKRSTSGEDFDALSRLDYLTKGLRKFQYEDQQLVDIIELLKKIGGEKYLHISMQGTNQDAASP